MQKKSYLALCVFITVFLFQSLITHDHAFLAGNDASRFAQIESLVDYGIPNIDESRYHWTVDRVTIAGKDYSNKPPVLSLLGAGVYAILRRLFGITFAHNESTVVYILTLTIVGGMTAWLVTRFFSSLGKYENITSPQRIITTGALATGTILTSFSSTFNNHVVAAVLLFAALQASWSGHGARAGLLIALTTCVDIVPGLVFTPLFALILLDGKNKKVLVNYFLSLCFGAMIFIAANWFIVNSPFPPKMVPGALEHGSGSYQPGEGSVHVNVPSSWLPSDWGIPLQGLFGWHGFFSMSPVLIFGLFGMVKAIRSGEVLNRYTSLLLGIGCLILICGHVLMLASFGGWSYGYRYLIPIVPILLFYVPQILSKFRLRLFGIVLIPSVICAWVGVYNPWPPIHELEARLEPPFLSTVTNPFGANLSAMAEEYFPDTAFSERVSGLFVNPDKKLRNQYLYIFYKSKGNEELARKYYDKIMSTMKQRPPF